MSVLPPQAIESERYVLGALIMTEGRTWDQIDWLKGDWFYRSAHRAIYAAIQARCEAGKPIDAVLLADGLGEALSEVGGPQYIGQLVIDTPAVSNIKHHANQVQRAYALRQIAAKAMDVGAQAYDVSADPQELAEQAADQFAALMNTKDASDLIPMHRAIAEAIDWMDSPNPGQPTGFLTIDRYWNGMQPGDLIIIAGRPSMGKSALAFNIAEAVARDTPVLFASLEMTARALGKRAMGYHESQVGRSAAYQRLSNLKLWIDQKAGVGVAYLRARAKRLKRQHGLGLIVVDYLQLMTAQGENRTQEIAVISRGLKQLAKDLEIPVIAVSQLNRSVESRPDRRPQMSDLRESGQIEQDADIISFVYRDDYYNPESPLQGIAELITRKHREGATGTAYLDFIPEFARFKDHNGHIPRMEQPRRAGSVRSIDFKQRAGNDQ